MPLLKPSGPLNRREEDHDFVRIYAGATFDELVYSHSGKATSHWPGTAGTPPVVIAFSFAWLLEPHGNLRVGNATGCSFAAAAALCDAAATGIAAADAVADAVSAAAWGRLLIRRRAAA